MDASSRNGLPDRIDEGLQAFSRFLDAWSAEIYLGWAWADDMKDQNIVFALESERLDDVMIHDRPAARDLWARLIICRREEHRQLVSSPAIMRRSRDCIPRSRACGARNRPAPRSSPSTSTPSPPTAMSKATTRPSRKPLPSPTRQRSIIFLSDDSGHRIQIGDASTVFWADASDAEAAASAEELFARPSSHRNERRRRSDKAVGTYPGKACAPAAPSRISSPICRRVSASSFWDWRRTPRGSRYASTLRMISA